MVLKRKSVTPKIQVNTCCPAASACFLKHTDNVWRGNKWKMQTSRQPSEWRTALEFNWKVQVKFDEQNICLLFFFLLFVHLADAEIVNFLTLVQGLCYILPSVWFGKEFVGRFRRPSVISKMRLSFKEAKNGPQCSLLWIMWNELHVCAEMIHLCAIWQNQHIGRGNWGHVERISFKFPTNSAKIWKLAKWTLIIISCVLNSIINS